MSAAVPILMYHAVGHRPADAVYGLSVSPGAFRAQMEILAGRGFTRSPRPRWASAGVWDGRCRPGRY